MLDLNNLVLDSSKITTYMSCPRKFFYRYVLNWTQETSNIHLVFGEAWHRAKEYLFINGMTKKTIDEAMDIFEEYYRQHFSSATDMDFVKNPGSAKAALLDYLDTHGNIHDRYKPIMIEDRPATELYGTVPISDEHVIHFKIDAIMEDNMLHKKVVFDHKTSGRDSAMYQIQWTLSTQMLTYLHAVNTLFNPNDVHGLIVDISILRKKDSKHVRILVKKTVASMNEWLVGLNTWVNDIYTDYQLLQWELENGRQMSAFRKNSTNCTKYNKLCPYFDFCSAWPNPLEKIANVPQGFVVDVWDPGKKEDGRIALTL